MKKYPLLILISLILCCCLQAQELSKDQSNNHIIVGDNPSEVGVFYEEIKDIFVKKDKETETEHIARIKSSLASKKYKGKAVNEIVLLVQDGFLYDSLNLFLTVSFYNRKIIDSDFTINLATLQYGSLVNGLEVPETTVSKYQISQLKENLRLAVYGFPIGFDIKHKLIKIMPLRYVFFNGITGAIYSDTISKNLFAEYYSRNDLSPESVLFVPDNYAVDFGDNGSGGNSRPKTVRVRSYYRGNGTYVNSYWRSRPH